MTIQEIYEQVLLDAPNIVMRNFIKRYNEAVEILAIRYDTAGYLKTYYIDTTGNDQEWYDLPPDCKGVKRVNFEDSRELRSYKCEKGQISFGCSGNFSIEYLGTPSKLVKLETAPMHAGIHESYHIPIVKYILAQELPERFALYMDMYDELSQKADERLRNMKRKNMRIPTRPFR